MIYGPDSRHFGYTIFCDDLRQEVGGKLTYIGVYSGTLIAHGDFPFTLPKFAMVINYIEKGEGLTSLPKLRVYFPGDPDEAPTIEGELNMAEARANAPKDHSPEDPIHIGIQLQFLMAPVILKSPGAIKARIIVDDITVKIGRLEIKKAEAQA